MATISSPRIVPLVRKLRDAGVPPVAAEALGETMEQVVTRAELREELAALEARLNIQIRLEIAKASRQMMLTMIAVQGLGVALIVLFLK